MLPTVFFLSTEEYLCTHLNFKYVLLGKFQTDDLEARFGQYRQMSGAHYNISVAQVVESEKKLKTLSIIKVFSAKHHEIEIKDICIDEKETTVESTSCDISDFEDISYELGSVDISENDVVGITYIGGYVCHKMLTHLQCDSCKSRFVLLDKKTLLNSKAISYFTVIDRGKLQYPSDFVINSLLISLRVFKVIICDRYENKFLKCKCQRKVLLSVICNVLDNINIEPCISCSTDLTVLFKKCLFKFCNILLNNYTKLKKQNLISDSKQKCTKKRKLDKLSNKM